MKRLFYLAILWVCLSAEAQDLKKFYIQTLHAEGMLYFVFPQKMPEVKEGKRGCREDLSYDYTYLDARDSVSLLMTTFTEPIFNADSVRIGFPSGEQKAIATEMIYCQSTQKGWECRLRCTLHYNDWLRMYHGAQPFTLTLAAKGSDWQPCFGDKPGKWAKLSTRFIRLQEIIRLNRKKK